MNADQTKPTWPFNDVTAKTPSSLIEISVGLSTGPLSN